MPSIITNITDQPNQNLPIPLPDGSTVTMSLVYMPQQLGWFYNLSWDGQTPPWQLNGCRIVVSPNILREHRNEINFGLSVVSSDNTEIMGQEDWTNGKATMLLIDETEVVSIEEVFFPGG
jgi:hypothetical protein